MTPAERQRFKAKVDYRDDGCWRWTGAVSKPTTKRPGSGGYALFVAGGKTRTGHRLSYENYVGPIPPGLQIDHLCHPADGSCPGGTDCLHRRCVNPIHLEAKSGKENSRRTGNATLTVCPAGHEYDEANTYVDKTGRRHCRTCRRARTQIWYETGGAAWHRDYHQSVRKQKGA